MHAIRFADPEDAPQISSLVCSLVDVLLVDPGGEDAQRFYQAMEPANLAKVIAKQDRFYLVAEANGVIHGMILVLNNNYIGQFFVYAAHQGKGVGSSLWARALSHAKHAGGDGGFTVKSSIAAEPVYRRLGFVSTGAAAVESGFRYIPMSRMADPLSGRGDS